MYENEGVFFGLKRLETPRLILRKLAMRDAHDIFTYSSDPEVTRYVQWSPHLSPGDSRAYIRSVIGQYRADDPASWGLEYKPTGQIIGTAGFSWWNHVHHSAEVGYSLSRAFWNMGLMTEALEAIIDFGFDRMRLYRIEAQHDVRNPASGRVMQKAGMVREGTLRGRLFSKGEYVDVELYAILRYDKRPPRRW